MLSHGQHAASRGRPSLSPLVPEFLPVHWERIDIGDLLQALVLHNFITVSDLTDLDLTDLSDPRDLGSNRIQQDPTEMQNKVEYSKYILWSIMEYSKRALKERKSLKLLKPFADLSGLPC
jgi:hypothetical protein